MPYFSESEIFVFIISIIGTVLYFNITLRPLFRNWPKERLTFNKYVILALPLFFILTLTAVLSSWASFDVVQDVIYKIYYIVIGFTLLLIFNMIVFMFLDISYRDDIINNNNKAAAIAYSGLFIAFTFIYLGTNIGDGYGYWCVLFPLFLGTFTLFCLVRITTRLTKCLEKITCDRQISQSIRFLAFVVSCSLIIARASAGDWTSTFETIKEFMVAWPVLIILVGHIIFEKIFKGLDDDNGKAISLLYSVIIVVIGIIVFLLMPPLPNNPMYGLIAWMI